MKKIIVFILLSLLIILGFIFNPFGSPQNEYKKETFVVPEVYQEVVVIKKLEDEGFIKHYWALDLVLSIKNKHTKIESGGYYLSKNMNVFEVADIITSGADLKWITFPEGLRKEQIGERLQKLLGWSNKELSDWNNTYTAMKYDYFEGVYFPDTYLIPVDESGLAIANRMIDRFNEKAKEYIEGFARKDILWTTGLKIASLIQREAAGAHDMKLISGVIWNRLEKGQKLEIDATVQYAKGKVGEKWWSVVTGSDIRNINSPYSTYKNKGLPPHPISNPGLNAIEAALNPEETDCIFYLHAPNRQIYCAVTYEEHLENIEKYLK